ncbi:unnamed protein product [Arctia plantaginis]|uniref:Uncharacterized protein n=1 Tax=Arctia plantaginis TaxID=874455 RepID=A0A8S1AAL2_ARCPL|nr:unnamed protein product [Arctia plantaginis]
MCGVNFWTFAVLMVCLARSSVHAGLTKEEIATMLDITKPHLEECSKEHGVSLDNLKEIEDETNENFSCFMSCFLKKIEVFDEKGIFDPKKSKENARSFIKNEETLTLFDKVADECSKVNDAEVSDGIEGCERAKLLSDCWKEHLGKLM